MKNYTDEQIKAMYENLPEDLKDAIFSVDMTEIIKKIGEKHGLHIDKIGELGNETGMVMLGVTSPKDFIPNLSKRIGGDKENLRKIAEEVNAQIFRRVRESLKEIHQMGSAKPAPVQPAKEEVKSMASSETAQSDIAQGEEKSGTDAMPKIFGGVSKPEPIIDSEPLPGPFEAKTGEGVFRMPVEESKQEEPENKPDTPYSAGDPYREPVE